MNSFKKIWKKLDQLEKEIDCLEAKVNGNQEQKPVVKAHQYKSAKMRDGKIWMLEDLREEVEGAVWNEEYNCYLYTWDQAQKAVPKGWRLPTIQDFITLAMAYGWPDGDREKLAREFVKDLHVKFAGDAHGSSLYDQGSDACWWSSSLYSTPCAYYLRLDTGNIYTQNLSSKYHGFSVRCLQDTEKKGE